MTRLILVRHANTNDNNAGRLSGHSDSVLSDKGRLQIEELTKFLEKQDIDTIYTTTSTRTKETVKNVAKSKNIEIIQKNSLREINFGKFEGLTSKDIEINYKDEFDKMITDGDKYKFPEGESLIDFYDRSISELNDILKSDKDKNILICTHGGTIRNIISYLMSNSHKYHWNFKIDNASVTIIDIVDGFAIIDIMNQTKF